MNNELKKTLGLSAALSTVIGVVIGSGVFFKPQAIYTATNGGPGLGMIAWYYNNNSRFNSSRSISCNTKDRRYDGIY